MENEKLQEQTESMADYEAHFDDANPWNVVARYQEEGTNLHVKVEGIVNGGVIAMVEDFEDSSRHPAFLFLISKIWRLIF